MASASHTHRNAEIGWSREHGRIWGWNNMFEGGMSMIHIRKAIAATLAVLATVMLASTAHAQWTVTILNPVGLDTNALAVSGGQQAGAYQLVTSYGACLWSGTAASWVDLHPAGMYASVAYAVSGGQQAGYVDSGFEPHACLWSGTAASWVDFNPVGSVESVAFAISGGQQAGYAVVGGVDRASLWSGTASSWVDLHPAGTTLSVAYAISGGQQAGVAYVDSLSHASLWSGTAASWVDLNPAGSIQSFAYAASGGQQAGNAYVGGVSRASLWSGTAASWLDLSAYLPFGFEYSVAKGLSSDGNHSYVVGYGSWSGRSRALLWTRPLSPPSGVQASDLGTCIGVNVSWNRVDFAESYNIYRNTINDSGSAFPVGSQVAAGSNFFDTTAAAGVVYYYWLTAVHPGGETDYSTPDTGWWANQPPPPANVSATDGTTCDVTITWTREPTATLYVVRRNTVNEPLTSIAIAVIPDGSVTQHVDTTATEGVTYYYWVRSSNGCAMGPSYGTPDSGSRAPGSRPPPSIFNASDGTGCNIVVCSWSTVLNVTGYEVLRAPVNDPIQALPIGTSTTNSFIDTSQDVRSGGTFYYWVRSLNTCGAGPLSAANPGFASLPPLITSQPTRAVANAGGSASFSVAAIRASSYQWRRNSVPLSDGGSISGSATPTLTISPVGPEHAGGYTVLVTGTCGSQQSSPPAILTVLCVADMDDGSGTGTPDGGVGIEDLLYYLAVYDAGDARADVDDGTGTGTPDGGVGIEDLLYFLQRYDAGC
jgi:hypothetical protein